MSRPIYDRLAKMPKKKLDKLEYDHQQHIMSFAKDGKSDIYTMDLEKNG